VDGDHQPFHDSRFGDRVTTVQVSLVRDAFSTPRRPIVLQVWDTRAQKRWSALLPDASVWVAADDVKVPSTLTLISGYTHDYRQCLRESGSVVVCANKIDAINGKDNAPRDGRDFARDAGHKSFVTPAKTKLRTDDPARLIADRSLDPRTSHRVRITDKRKTDRDSPS
jgi:hypothetical protein